MQAETSVCAVVVTYNRRVLLEECLDRIAAQSRPPDQVLVIDNASTDATDELLAAREGIEVVCLPRNVGSSGGFAEGIRRAHDAGFGWLWLLDDDTFAEESALERLLEGAARAPAKPALMASVVRWQDGRLHPMNRPWLRLHRRREFAQGARVGLAAIRTATWVSILVSRQSVEMHGLPARHFFIWLDDMEYTARLLRDEVGYIVPDSVVFHWTPRPYDTLTDARDRFYYKARNHLWLLRGSGFSGLERAGYAAALLRAIVVYLRQTTDKQRALRTVLRGLRDGLGAIPS